MLSTTAKQNINTKLQKITGKQLYNLTLSYGQAEFCFLFLPADVLVQLMKLFD